MALILRHAAEQYPGAGWEPSSDHLVVVSGETVVGSLKTLTGGTAGDRWSWSITCVVGPVGAKVGWAESREEARAQFAAAWRAWLNRTGLRG